MFLYNSWTKEGLGFFRKGSSPLHSEALTFKDKGEIQSLLSKRPCVLVRGAAGFTLIELLIAASISAVIIVSIYSAFQSGIVTYNRIERASGIYQDARMILNRLELDLKNAYIYSRSDSGFKGDLYRMEFYSSTDSFIDKDNFLLVGLIKYSLENNTLSRSSYRGVESIEDDNLPEPEELSSSISDITFEYGILSDNPDAPFKWQESWPGKDTPEQIKMLPLAVKIKLTLIEDDNGRQRAVDFTKVVALSGS